jgi:hypothetical protein
MKSLARRLAAKQMRACRGMRSPSHRSVASPGSRSVAREPGVPTLSLCKGSGPPDSSNRIERLSEK